MDFSKMDQKRLAQELIDFRRARHRRPESAWTEFLTTSEIIGQLEQLGIPYKMGREIHTSGERYGVPPDE